MAERTVPVPVELLERAHKCLSQLGVIDLPDELHALLAAQGGEESEAERILAAICEHRDQRFERSPADDDLYALTIEAPAPEER